MMVRCSKSKPQEESITGVAISPLNIDGRPVLQPNCNRLPLLERHKYNTACASSVISRLPPTTTADYTTCKVIHKVSPPAKLLESPTSTPIPTPTPTPTNITIKDHQAASASNSSKLIRSSSTSKSLLNKSTDHNYNIQQYSSSVINVESPGSIAAARREQVAILQVQRKMRIAHYGRISRSLFLNIKILPDTNDSEYTHSGQQEIKRCTFITPNSDPIYVAYHDEEWGVPVHEDKWLFELLVLTGAQVGSDWTSVLKKRQDFRDAFSGFDPKIVSKFSERRINSLSSDYGIELSQARGVVDNSNRILEIKKEFGSFDKYLWGFVNHKPIGTHYKFCHKIPAKTSKSEMISKDMVRRGFRLVGPTVVHSFMQAAGLTNDHLTTCARHSQCLAIHLQPTTNNQLPSSSLHPQIN